MLKAGSGEAPIGPDAASDDRLKVFLSYSRADMATADAMVVALERNGFEVIIDRRDLPYGEEWQAELGHFIATSDTVVWLVSPDSVRSKWCNWELGEVGRLSKRVVPVLVRAVSPDALPEALGKIHLLPAEGVYDPDGHEADLVAALNTDRAWLKTATSLGEDAREWVRNGRDAARLLRGRELSDAENWSLRAPRGAPPPASEILELIVASRRAQRRRQRLTVMGSVAAAIVATGLAATSVWFGLEARDQAIEAERQRVVAETNEEKATEQEKLALEREAEAQAERARADEAAALAQAETREKAAQLRQAQINESRYIASSAGDLVGKRRYETALALTLHALPEDLDAEIPTRPFVGEAMAPLYALRQSDRLRAVLLQEGSSSSAIAFSPDDTIIATGQSDWSVALWDRATGAMIRQLRTDSAVNCVAFSPDGTLVAACGEGATRVWEVASGAERMHLAGHSNNVIAARFSPDGKTMVTAAWDNTARLWNVADGSLIAALEGHTGSLLDVAYSPDGRLIATASQDNTARLWNAADGRSMGVLEGHTSFVESVSFSGDGTRLVTASRDATAKIWDTESGAAPTTLSGHFISVDLAVFSPDGSQVATASSDKKVGLWDAATGQQVRMLEGHEERPFLLAFSPDGARIHSGSYDGTVRVWSASTGQALATLGETPGRITDMALSGDGKLLAAVTEDGSARAWDVTFHPERAVVKAHSDAISGFAFAPAGDRYATASDDGTARLWPIAGGAPVVLAGHTEAVTGVAFAPDGRTVATASADATIRIWDAANGKQIRVLSGHRSGVNSVAFSADGKQLVSTSHDSDTLLWTLADGSSRIVAPPVGPRGSRYDAKLSPDGTIGVSVSVFYSPTIFDAATGENLRWLEGHTSSIYGADFSPDGKRLVTASDDKTARLWDPHSGEEIGVLRGHEDLLYSAAFSPDGSRIATASRDGTARIWDVASLTQIAVFTHVEAAVMDVTFAPDGLTVATATTDGVVHLWATPPAPDAMLAISRAAQVRAMAPAERRDYGVPEPVDATATANVASTTPVTECDRLATHPDDPVRVVAGVRFTDIDVEAAISACDEATATYPDSGRLRFNLGRALDRAGRSDEARSAYEQAAESGHAYAAYNIAVMHLHGSGFAEDRPKAFELFEKSFAMGALAGGFTAGHMLWRGDGAPADKRGAVALWKQAARRGDHNSSTQLGWVYELGREGLPRDPALALAYYARAIDLLEANGRSADARVARSRRATLARLLPDDVVKRAWERSRRADIEP